VTSRLLQDAESRKERLAQAQEQRRQHELAKESEEATFHPDTAATNRRNRKNQKNGGGGGG
jgi:hypothetical protein